MVTTGRISRRQPWRATRRGRRTQLGIVGVIAAVLLAACGGGGGEEETPEGGQADGEVTFPDYYPADYGDMVEASRDETGVDVYGILPVEDWEILIDGFHEVYPWIEVNVLDLGTAEVFERYSGEAAGGGSEADMLQSTASGSWWTFVNEEDAVEPYESPEAEHLPEATKPLPGVYTMSTDPLLLMYNKSLLSEDQYPESMADLKQLAEDEPELVNNKLTTYNIAEAYATWWWLDEAQPEQYQEWFSALGPVTRPEASAGPMVEKIAIGEYVAGYYLSIAVLGLPIFDGAGGDVLGWAVAKDSAPLFARNIGIPVGADSPNSAKLLLDYLLSEEGQTLYPEASLVPARDVEVPEDWFTYESLEAQVDEGALILNGPTEELASPEVYDSFTAEWNTLFNR